MGVLYGETSTTLEKLGTESAVVKGENSQSWEVELGTGIKVDDGRRIRDG